MEQTRRKKRKKGWVELIQRKKAPTEALNCRGQLDISQMNIYAQELADLYKKEKELRKNLEESNRCLEQKVKDLTALNNLFQQHLNMRFQVEESLKNLVARIHSLAAETYTFIETLDDESWPITGYAREKSRPNVKLNESPE